MRAVPSQKIVYVVMSDHRDMKGIDAGRWRENGFSQDLVGNVQDRLVDGQERNARQQFESALSKSGIAIGRLVEDVLRGHEFVVRPFCGPPALRQ